MKIGEWVLQVWVARTGAWEDKTQEAAAFKLPGQCWRGPFLKDLQGHGGHEPADRDINHHDGPNRLGSGKSRCAHFGFGYRMGLTSPEDLIDLRAMDTAA